MEGRLCRCNELAMNEWMNVGDQLMNWSSGGEGEERFVNC